MKKSDYQKIENYMLACMADSAHDSQHIYRVLFTALDIAQHEKDVNFDVLISACLLHDIGRKEQSENPKLCHAEVGAEKARKFLIENGFSREFAESVADCIRARTVFAPAPCLKRLRKRFCLTQTNLTPLV